ncbi:hypothetical protein ACN47E_007199 [Coniothyrium glycines]
MTPALPTLTTTPVPYAGCCLALSHPLLQHLSSLLSPPPRLALSIGSGYGLLEALLLALNANIAGVEVAPSSNTYLPEANHRLVHGSRFLDPIAADAHLWMFVYPRRAGLVKEYLDEYGHGRVERIIWAGPRADWQEYVSCFDQWQCTVRGADEVGGRAWELIAVADRLSL